MPSCIECIHHKIFPKDLALLRMSNNPHQSIRYKCLVKSPKIRTKLIKNIIGGPCPDYKPTKKS